MTESTVHPFGSIALALSGGGYRAAAFHLGALKTLHDVGLLKDVHILSTVSGGSFVGAAYSVSACRQQPFDNFFQTFRERLRTQRPIHRASELLTSHWNRRLPRCTLIVAQAEAIDEQFFDGIRFGELFDRPSHLEEIAFNATDFRAGLPFRFQKSRNPRIRIGNGKHWIPLDVARQLRLADIVAASSCFPGGFEPIGFPHDFHWPNRADILHQLASPLERPAERAGDSDSVSIESDDSPFVQPIPLMDGGVADNQALGTLLSAIERHKSEKREVGLVFICDADQAPTKPLLEHQRNPQPFGLRMATVFLFARVLGWVGVIATLLLTWRLFSMVSSRQFGSWLSFVETILSLLVVSATVGALAWISRFLRKFVWDRLPKNAGLDVAKTIEQTTTGWLGELVWMRVESVFAMSNSVFMKNLRDLRYRVLFNDERYRHHVLANLIYDLLSGRHGFDCVGGHVPNSLLKLAEQARDMPTTLWCDEEKQLDAAIMCGRFTTCFNLLRHISEQSETRQQELRGLSAGLHGLWSQLCRECSAADQTTPQDIRRAA